MSTIRYCGDITIRVTYLDAYGETYSDGTIRNRNGKYRCFLRAPGMRSVTIFVGAPAFLSHAVDCPEAFDEAAHAAISFADDEHGSWSDHACPKEDGSGWAIERKLREKALA